MAKVGSAAALVEGLEDRFQDDQRESGDADREARLPEPDRQVPPPDPGRRLLRVDGRERRQEATSSLPPARMKTATSPTSCRQKSLAPPDGGLLRGFQQLVAFEGDHVSAVRPDVDTPAATNGEGAACGTRDLDLERSRELRHVRRCHRRLRSEPSTARSATASRLLLRLATAHDPGDHESLGWSCGGRAHRGRGRDALALTARV
jgi:hypothetical protein